MNKICLECNKEYFKSKTCSTKQWTNQKYCSKECYRKNWDGHKYGVKIKKGQRLSPLTEFKKGKIGDRNEKHPQWKGDNVGYSGIHTWLRINFGYPNKCDNEACLAKNIKRFEWALIKGKEYERKRENFMQLCVSCHRKYDMTEKKRLNMSLSQLKRKRV
jgi:hypothetical protein